MISKDKILKIDLFTPNDARILSVNAKQFSIPSHVSQRTGRLENILMIKGRNLPEVDMNCLVYVIFYMRNGDRIRYNGYISLSTELQLNILLSTNSPQLMEERRRYYKVEANIDCLITKIQKEEGDLIVTPSRARIQDLNIGGVFICVSDQTLDPKDSIEITLHLTDNDPVCVSAEVLRVQKNAAGDVTGYGCRFCNVTPRLEETLAKFVYKAQVEALKKNGTKIDL